MICAITISINALSQEGLNVKPLTITAGSLQTIQYTFTVGERPIEKGGGIRIEIPVSYAETEFLFWSKPQVSSEEDLGYVSAVTSTKAPVILKSHGLLGGIVDVVLSGNSLRKGDKITIKYKGKVQSLSGNVEVRYALKKNTTDTWQRQSSRLFFRILPLEASHILISYPSDITTGQLFDVALTAIDRFGNPATGHRGSLQLSSTDASAVLPVSSTFSPSDSGVLVVKNVQFKTKGFQKIIATDKSNKVKIAFHYAWVDDKPAVLKHLFGDTHFHTGTGTGNQGFFTTEGSGNINTLSTKEFNDLNLGGDHRANFTYAIDAYNYAVKIMRLDFGSCSEHDSPLLTDQVWSVCQEITDSFYKPGQFTTFYAYEWTPDTNHYIVMHKTKTPKIFDHYKYADVSSLWKALKEQGEPAITIPHVSWAFENHNIWNHINDEYTRVGEIYSLWNSRFLVQPDDMPQLFELGEQNKWTYHYAWSKGHHIGIVGSTDNHLGRPAANNYTIYTQHTGGLAVALSKENNREELWDAFQQRRTYATTGTRIYMDFTADGNQIGSEFKSNMPSFKGKIAGTNRLASLEVVKMEDGKFKTVYESNPMTETFQFAFTDSAFTKSAMYYLRVKQVDEYAGRRYSHSTAEMAWSSPVWINKN